MMMMMTNANFSGIKKQGINKGFKIFFWQGGVGKKLGFLDRILFVTQTILKIAIGSKEIEA